MHIAADKGFEDVISVLVSIGASPDVPSKVQRSAAESSPSKLLLAAFCRGPARPGFSAQPGLARQGLLADARAAR
jgi:hypothetical protein